MNENRRLVNEPNLLWLCERVGTTPSLSRLQGVPLSRPRQYCARLIVTLVLVAPSCCGETSGEEGWRGVPCNQGGVPMRDWGEEGERGGERKESEVRLEEKKFFKSDGERERKEVPNTLHHSHNQNTHNIVAHIYMYHEIPQSHTEVSRNPCTQESDPAQSA